MTETERRLLDQEYFRYNFLRIWGRRYAHMKARVEGRSTNRSNAGGKELMTKEEFFKWCKDFDNLDSFMSLWFDWANSGFKLWNAPSIDRIYSDKGYVIDNIQWLSFSANCEKNNRNPITHEELGDEDF